METRQELPKWLDDYIFNELGAKYSRTNTNMTVIDWGKEDMLSYLGTYFPRSYTEAYCIFSDYFKDNSTKWIKRNSLSVLDFCCGTGGEIIGLLTAMEDTLKNIESVKIYAHDGNRNALRLFEKVISKFEIHTSLKIEYKPSCIEIDDLYDLSGFGEIITDKFDIVMSFKAICEFVDQERLEDCNAYAQVAKFFLPKMNESGIMLLEDVTTKSKIVHEWLTKLLDKGLQEADVNIANRNSGYNQTFTVSHSRKQNDISKVAWRIITERNQTTI